MLAFIPPRVKAERSGELLPKLLAKLLAAEPFPFPFPLSDDDVCCSWTVEEGDADNGPNPFVGISGDDSSSDLSLSMLFTLPNERGVLRGTDAEFDLLLPPTDLLLPIDLLRDIARDKFMASSAVMGDSV